jgi:hypothetical protein
MIEVSKTSNLADYLAYFSGKDHLDALAKAEAWAKSKGIELINYFVQGRGKTIIVGFNKPINTNRDLM